jgi:hypothetical protein
MKKILAIVVTIAFLLMPSISPAKITAITDSELSDISAQAGSITISFDDLILKDSLGNVITNRMLKSIATDGYNYWDPDHQYDSPYFNLGIKADKTKYPGTGYFDQEYQSQGFFGYEVYLTTDGLVRRSGSLTMQVVEYDADASDAGFFETRNIWSRSVLKVMVGYKDMEGNVSDPLFNDTGNMGILVILKLSESPDLSNGQTLGRIYTGRVTATTQGSVTVYAHSQLSGSGMSRLGPAIGGNPIP